MLTNDTRAVALSYTCSVHDQVDGKDLNLVTLRNGTVTVRITNLGCAIIAIHTPDRNGVRKNIVAGFSSPEEYRRNPWYFGCIVGRYANRIAGGRFTLDGHTIQLSRNNDGNHLHGGFEGFHKKIWDVARAIHNDREVGVVFSYISRDGEEGYPGTVSAEVQYTLTRDHQLKQEYRAATDKRTPINLTNHSYFNLTGFDDPLVTDHILRIRADGYTEKGPDNLPTGRIIPLSGSPLDFSTPLPIGRNIECFPLDKGFDHNFVLTRRTNGAGPGDLLPAGGLLPAADLPAGAGLPSGAGLPAGAELFDPVSGRILRLWTDQPGLQLYTANWWDGTVNGAHGSPYVKHGAVALETQAFPDSPNHPAFPDTILIPGDSYHATTILEFDIRE